MNYASLGLAGAVASPFRKSGLHVGECEGSAEYDYGQAKTQDRIAPAAECLFHDDIPLSPAKKLSQIGLARR